MIRSVAIVLALLLPAEALAQTKPRETVGAIATEIRARYFSAEKGDAIADALEAETAAGKYDALTDPRDLAAALSARLNPEDAHFAVTWSADQASQPLPQGHPAGPGPGPRRPPPGEDPFRLVNYGFSRAEILPGNIGVIEMRQFANIEFDTPDDPARRAADAALALVANADAVVFDLRNNGGGSPAMVGYLVSAFTPADANIYNVFHSRQGTRDEKPGEFHAEPNLTVPLYILTSGRTGSAAEAMPYTLQAAKRATIVGEASGGAANPGGMAPIPGGFRVFISSGSPINPVTGKNWEGTGVLPDIVVPAASALDAARRHALKAIIAKDASRTDAVWSLESLEAAGRTLPAAELSAYAGTYGPITIVAENGKLESRRGRRPALELSPLGKDQFFVSSDPWIRYSFERDGAGKIIALEQRDPYGPSARQRRDP